MNVSLFSARAGDKGDQALLLWRLDNLQVLWLKVGSLRFDSLAYSKQKRL